MNLRKMFERGIDGYLECGLTEIPPIDGEMCATLMTGETRRRTSAAFSTDDAERPLVAVVIDLISRKNKQGTLFGFEGMTENGEPFEAEFDYARKTGWMRVELHDD